MSRMPPRPVLTSRSLTPRAARLVLDGPLHRLDFVDLGETEILAVDERLHAPKKIAAQLQVAGDGPDLDERLPLPGAAERIVVGQRAGQRLGQRPAPPFGTQPQVNAVRLAAIRVCRQEAHDLADHAGEEVTVGDALDVLAARRPFLVVKEHQVDVAAVVQLLAAEFAERETRSRRRPTRVGERLTEALGGRPQGRGQGDLQGDVGHAGNVARHLLQRAVTDDVVGADAERLFLAETAEGAQHRRVFECGVDLGPELVAQLGLARATPQRHTQHVEVIRVERQQVAKELARAEELQQDFERSAAVFEQRRQSTGTGAVAEKALEVVQRHVRVRRTRQNAAEGGVQVAQPLRLDGGGEVLEVAAAAVEVAEAPGVQGWPGVVGSGDRVGIGFGGHGKPGQSASGLDGRPDFHMPPDVNRTRRKYIAFHGEGAPGLPVGGRQARACLSW